MKDINPLVCLSFIAGLAVGIFAAACWFTRKKTPKRAKKSAKTGWEFDDQELAISN